MNDNNLNRGLDGIVVAKTGLSYIDGEKGDLVIGGFPISELAAEATYEETVFLLLNGRLPSNDEYSKFRLELANNREISEEVRGVLKLAAEEGKPAMDALRMGTAAANLGVNEDGPHQEAKRVIAILPTIVATYWRYHQGESPVVPRPDLSHAANYLYMLTDLEPTDAEIRGLETYLNTVVDHGLNASTFSARSVVSTESDVVSAATAAIGSLKGPLHGGAPGPVLDMLKDVHESGEAEAYVRERLEHGERLMGFGHRVYQVRDPRAAILSDAAEQFYDSNGDSEFFQTVQEFERTAVDLLSEYKPGRNLETNVEYYTAALLHGIGIPQELFTSTFAVSRVGGWMAHCLEQLDDNRIIRPRSEYIGSKNESWKPLSTR